MRELDALARMLEVRARSGALGEHGAKRRGGASEFQEHRPYSPGDDLRRIDWAAYARTDEPVLKLFRAEEDVVVRVACDASGSLDFGEPKKIDVARRLASAIGYMALSRSERAELWVARDGRGAPKPVARGRSGLVAFLRGVEAVEAAGATNLASSIDVIVRRAPRPGMLAVISDFLDPGPVLLALARARSRGHDLALVHVFALEEEDPALEGDLTLEDSETGETVEVTIDARALDAYRASVGALRDGMRAFARKSDASYVRVRTDESLVTSMRRFVARAID